VTHYLGKNHHKKGLVEWFKVSALSSNPSAAKKKKKVIQNTQTFLPQEQYTYSSKIVQRGLGFTSVVQHLLSMYEVLGLGLTTTKTKEKKRCI
jgi:hypothetical protein